MHYKQGSSPSSRASASAAPTGPSCARAAYLGGGWGRLAWPQSWWCTAHIIVCEKEKNAEKCRTQPLQLAGNDCLRLPHLPLQAPPEDRVASNAAGFSRPWRTGTLLCWPFATCPTNSRATNSHLTLQNGVSQKRICRTGAWPWSAARAPRAPCTVAMHHEPCTLIIP